MLTLLACLITDCSAADTVVHEEDTASQARAQVQEVQAHVDAQAEALDAIEHYLADKKRAQDGLAPDGWVQPTLASYAAPQAADSLIPTTRPAVFVDTTRPGPTP